MDTQTRRLLFRWWTRIGILFILVWVMLSAAGYLDRQDAKGRAQARNSRSAKDAGRKPATQARVSQFQRSPRPPDGTAKELARAWNQGSAKDVARMFTADGVLITPSGSQVRSRAAIQRVIADKRSGLLKDTRLTNTIDNISQSTADRATVKGAYRINGIRILGFRKAASGSYVLHQVKRGGRWLIARAELTRESEQG